jgi:RNA polymerase sigma factor for flagellar operon FliA
MMARKLKPAAAVGQALDEEDLCAEGRIAVLEALSTYGGYGIKEQTWVRTRIRQRMIDAVRRMDLRSREEVRLAVKYSAGEVEDSQENRARIVSARRLVSMDAATTEQEPMVNRICDSMAPLPLHHVERNAKVERLRTGLEHLSDRQRQALEMSLFEGKALREIGAEMGISESRVCQLQKRAVEHLKRSVRRDTIAP